MATITISAEKVIAACEEVIRVIQAERNKRDEKTINNAMNQRMFSFKRGFYKMNREESIKWIDEQGGFSSWGFSIYAWGELEHANKLLVLAKHGDPVTLNEEDTRILYG